MSISEDILLLPSNVGQAIVETGAVIACPLLGIDSFVAFCKERGESIDRGRLFRLERLGLFSPLFRVRSPKKKVMQFYIPIRPGNNWFTKKLAWDTTAIPLTYTVPNDNDRSQEGYYSIFQIDYLHLVLKKMTLQISLESYLDGKEQTINWQQSGEHWIEYAEKTLESFRSYEHRRSLSLLCQYISNRYYPNTQSDKRTISVTMGGLSDRWICIFGYDWDWDSDIRDWNPRKVEQLFALTPKKLRHAYETFAREQNSFDPLADWYELTQFVSVNERKKLKGDALRAETVRIGANMLRLLYQDLYGEELPNLNELNGSINTHSFELEVRKDPRRYLEFVVNRFGLNPQPKFALILEGQSEANSVQKIFEKYFGTHIGSYGIEIIVLGGVDIATGTKEDRFRAIFRLIDYLHHHQTITFLILDNENYAKKLKKEAGIAKSTHGKRSYITRKEYICIWKDSFEFDNFSCSEIAAALNKLAEGYANFNTSEVMECKNGHNPGNLLKKLYNQKTEYNLQKLKLSDILTESMLAPNSRRKVANRPIIKKLERVARLAALNPLPTTYDVWEKNQSSRYLSTKSKRSKI